MFFIDGNSVATVAVENGTVSTTVLVADGSHTYYATYQGDTNYVASTSTTQNLVIARAATSLTLTSTPISSNGTGVLQLSAKLSSTGAGTPTGTISFTNGGTTLGTVNLTSAVNDASTPTATGPVLTSIVPGPILTLTFNGYGTSMFVLKP